MRLYVQKDKANDQIYIGFGRGGAVERGVVKKTVQATDDIAFDLDRGGHLVGIDITNVSRALGRRVFTEPSTSDELVGVAEAAKLCGVRKPNFLRDFASKPDFPDPVVELSSGRIWLCSEVESYLKSRGRRAKELRHIA